MRVLVLNPPFVKNFCRTQRWAARTRGRVLRHPDWLCYAASVLQSHDFRVSLVDGPALGLNKSHIKKLANKSYDYVVIDSTTPSIYSDIEQAGFFKKAGSEVIMVGPHGSALPEETMKLAKGKVDVICRGEYDYTVKDVIDAKDLSKVRGITYMRGNRIKSTATRKPIENLDELPYPAWHMLDVKKYWDGGKLWPLLDMISGRGCPNRCSFCLWPQTMHGQRYRLRSVENVVSEMEYDVTEYPYIKEIFFEDDTFTVDRRRAREICEEIIKRKLDITWSVNCRCDLFDLELMKLMKKAGCRELLVGPESSDPKILRNVNKGITPQMVEKFFSIAKESGLHIHACFVMGLPGETRESMERTIKWAKKLDPHTLQFSACTPFPGTDLYNDLKGKGFIKAEKWSDWLNKGEQSAVVEYPDLSQEEIIKSVDRGLRKFYFRPKKLAQLFLSSKDLGDLKRKLKGGLNLIKYHFEKDDEDEMAAC